MVGWPSGAAISAVTGKPPSCPSRMTLWRAALAAVASFNKRSFKCCPASARFTWRRPSKVMVKFLARGVLALADGGVDVLREPVRRVISRSCRVMAWRSASWLRWWARNRQRTNAMQHWPERVLLGAAIGYGSGGKPVLQFDVPELVDATYLPQNASPMSIGEESHETPWQLVVCREPYPG